MTETDLLTRLEQALALGDYTVADVVAECRSGEMQWWQHGEGYVVTKIIQVDHKIYLSTPAIFGVWDDAHKLMHTLIEFAREHRCDAIVGEGRKGWFRLLPKIDPRWQRRGKYIAYD